MQIPPITIQELKKLAREIALTTLDISYKAKAGHVGSALSISDLLTVLYFQELNINKNNLKKEDRDRFILSKGHAAAALYAVLYKKGILNEKQLYSFGHNFGLCEHPEIHDPGVEMSTGSLGHGLAFGIGIALGNKKKNNSAKTWILISDGECGEGSVWEAALLASRLQLHNVAVIIDYNKWQCYGPTPEITPLEPFADKWRAFGWESIEINGHDIEQISEAFVKARKKNRPTVVIAHTISGHKISCIKDQLIGHYKVFSDEEYNQARKEIKST